MTKIKYFLGILVIIFILVSANHYFPFDLSKKAAFTSRNISLNTREGLLEPPKPIKLKNPPIAPQLTSEYAGQEMVKGKQSKIIHTIRKPSKMDRAKYIPNFAFKS